MKFIHISDLHIGKRVNEFSMVSDQEYILAKIINIADDERPESVLIAGDVYDKAVPSAEAVQLFDDFLVRLSNRKIKTFVISGNHDSPERIAFGGRLMDKSDIFMSPVYEGWIEPISLYDEYGKIEVYMLPFIKPSHVKRYFPEEEIVSYTDAVRTAIENMGMNTAQNPKSKANTALDVKSDTDSEECRKILVTHQFVTGAARCESEEISIGGSDNVDASVFDGFDYVALGHIHNPQQVLKETIRYCGTPLKYSFSEASHEKSVTVVELKDKGSVAIKMIPLVPVRDMMEIKGSYLEVTEKCFYSDLDTDSYIHITLTDEDDIPHAVGKLRAIYPNIMKLDYDNRRTREGIKLTASASADRKSPMELFGEFYEKQNNQPLAEEQSEYLSELIENIWEAGE